MVSCWYFGIGVQTMRYQTLDVLLVYKQAGHDGLEIQVFYSTYFHLDWYLNQVNLALWEFARFYLKYFFTLVLFDLCSHGVILLFGVGLTSHVMYWHSVLMIRTVCRWESGSRNNSLVILSKHIILLSLVFLLTFSLVQVPKELLFRLYHPSLQWSNGLVIATSTFQPPISLLNPTQ